MDRYTLGYYSPRRKRLLLLHCSDPVLSAQEVLYSYQLGDVSFINVFKDSRFMYRMYVRNNALFPFVGFEYDLAIDPYVRKKLLSDKPVLRLEQYLKMVPESIPGLTAILNPKAMPRCQ